MQFPFYPGHEYACPHVRHCPHLGSASLGTLVLQANTSGQTIDRLHRVINSQRKRISKLVECTLTLEEQLAQAKLELKLERQNKFATNQQKADAVSDDDESADDVTAGDSATAKKRGAPVGHPGWFRRAPTHYDWAVAVPAPKRCTACSGCVTAQPSLLTVDHLQEDIVESVYRVVSYQHEVGCCDDCGLSAQQAGKDEILGSRIGPRLRSLAVWLRNSIGVTYRKVPRILEEVYGIKLSPAALIGFEKLLFERVEPIVEDIRKKLASSDGAVHADETYWTTDGARSYFWVHANTDFVLFQYSTTRSGQVSRDVLSDDFSGTLVTDCYSGYAASSAGAKQKCLAHLARTARDWQKLTEVDSADFQFFDDIRAFVKRGCAFHRERAADSLSADDELSEKMWLRGELSRLAECDVTHEKSVTLQARLIRHLTEWLVFLDDPRVSPTNNLAERDLRPLVVLRKITFGHRTDAGAQRMAALMSVGETARRRGHRASDIYFQCYTRPPDKVLRHLYVKAYK